VPGRSSAAKPNGPRGRPEISHYEGELGRRREIDAMLREPLNAFP
jgi:hypothetical protein